MPNYTAGLDLAQTADYTALGIVERFVRPTGKTEWRPSYSALGGGQWKERPVYENVFHVVHLERFELGTSYPVIVDRVCQLLGEPPLQGQCELVVDATGIGRAVLNMLEERRPGGRYPQGMNFHGGNAIVHHPGQYPSVPTRDLATELQVLLQTGRLKIAEELPLAEVLMRELLAFRVKMNPKTGHDSYEAWRERDHDDLVFAVAMAVFDPHGQGHPRRLKVS
jgi:hypothetical protein